ncbi:DUF935 domain-containing protein [Treponema denticola]|uniref:DUF935 domain-containing protein n=1 Tax=Treponema denticola TaxID=158 RepID=UPI0021F87FB2|nr:DUF935 domain-containing protein [Treponema denticola]UYT08164.1 DUF935 domain-containing protein [Treponema denticola]
MGWLGRLGKKKIDEKKAVNKESLMEQRATPVANSNRDLWSGGLVAGLTPERLASILDKVRRGDIPAEYLEIAGELEERDAHYRSVLSTRKHAIEGLEMYVQSAGDDKDALAIAEAVTEDIAEHSDIMDLRKNALDALGKGFSVNEIIWNTSSSKWKPETFIFRDPRWFAYNKETGLLSLRDVYGMELSPLDPYKFIIHEPNLLSGKQITSGLSFTALFYWLVKTYDVTSWAAFADRFGYPVRLGKYGRKATKEDIATLKRAVAAIGSDVGAVIPDSMVIDIIESKTTSGTSEVYEKIADWSDKQLSKLALGQTASAEGTPGKLGDSQDQQAVRQDILKADVRQLEQTLNRDLVIPYVKFNFGRQERYPKLRIKYVEPKNVQLIVDSVTKLVPLGLKVKSQEMNTLLGLSSPEKDDEVLTAPSPLGFDMNSQNKSGIALNASEVSPDEIELDDSESGLIEITDDIAEVIEKAADKAVDFKSFETELEKLVSGWNAEKIARTMAIAFFKARAQGDNDFDKED